MTLRLFGIVAASVLQTLTIIMMLWRARTLHWTIAQSDLIVFLLPFLAAFCLNLLLLRPKTRKIAHVATTTGLALLLACLAQGAAMLWGLNVYGS